tara:strand:- start:37 stop:426 length:390 start_codon:yes stop_codon:yes gene_type:complete
MSLRFRGGERLQRGRGIGGLLRLVKSVFSPLVKTVAKAAKSNTGKALGNVLKEQAISSALNLTGDVIQGNNLKESLKNELKSGRETLGSAIKGIRKRKNEMNDKKIVKQRKVVSTKKKKLSFNKDFLGI